MFKSSVFSDIKCPTPLLHSEHSLSLCIRIFFETGSSPLAPLLSPSRLFTKKTVILNISSIFFQLSIVKSESPPTIKKISAEGLIVLKSLRTSYVYPSVSCMRSKSDASILASSFTASLTMLKRSSNDESFLFDL